MEYVFKLSYQLAATNNNPDALLERLGAAGCDDALVGIGLPGRVGLTFSREAGSALQAVASALADVRTAMPGARLVEASPDYVGLSDVAEAVGVSRQNMRKLMVAHSASFPLPVHEGSASVWHLAEVLHWLQERGGYTLDPALIEVANAAWKVNLGRAQAGGLVDDDLLALVR